MKGNRKNAGQMPADMATASSGSRQAMRKQAEEQVRTMAPVDLFSQTPEEIQRVLHELRVHQIELEMQNEELHRAEAALEESRTRYFDLYDLAPVGYCTLSDKGLILEANLTAATLLGASRTSLVKQPISRFILKEDQNIYYLHHKQLFEKGEPQECELRMVKANGAFLWAHLTATLAQAEDGAPICRMVLNNITERKQAEEELSESVNRYRSLFEKMMNGFAFCRMLYEDGKPSDFIYLNVNPAFEKQTGLTGVAGKKVSEVIPGIREADPKLFDLYGRVASTGEPAAFEFFLTTLQKWFAVSVYSPARDHFVVLFDVITERKRAEEDLRSSEERFSLATKSSQLAVWDWNVKDNTMVWDELMFKLYGITRESFPRCVDAWINGLHPDDKERAIEECNAALRGEKEYDTEFQVLHPDGTVLWIKANAVVTRDAEGNAVRMIGLNKDITDRKRIDEEKEVLRERLARSEKMEALGQLAGGVAHDLNNVLGVTMVSAELMQELLEAGSPLRRHVDRIYASTEKAAAMIQDLLTLARRGVSVSEALDLNRTVTNVLASAEYKVLRDFHPSVDFRTEIYDEQLSLLGSDVHLGKTVFNLISNAAEAISGRGTVTIRTERQYLEKPVHGYDEVKEGEYAVLTVRDTGGGIRPEYLNRIFEPFFTKKKMGRSGTGLGLAIVWGTVKDHAGYINVESKFGEGTTFALYFPITRDKIANEAVKIPVEQYLGHGESVLVVDDLAEQRQIAEEILTQLKYDVHAVASGEEAVEYLKENRADIIILDMIMEPGIDGLETYRRIRRVNPKQKAIIVSGFAETDRVNEARVLGAGTYVRKPYNRERIGIAIRRELERV